jgi:ABC-type nitrate/sulfonate/bicarbonate transport system substrate-binding protein
MPSLVIALALAAAAVPHARAQAVVGVRVVTATTPDIVSIPDLRAFGVFLPQEFPGAEAEVTYVPGASRAIHALIADEADVAIATLPAGLLAIENGQDIVAFSLASGARPYLHMVAHKEIRTWRDLEGQEIAIIGPVDATHYLAQVQMRAAGARPAEAVWRAVGGGAGRINALISGAAKATMLQSAQALEILRHEGFHLLPPAIGRKGDFIFKVYWAKRAFLRENRDLAEAIVRAHLRSIREALDKAKFLERAVGLLVPTSRETISRAYDMVNQRRIWEADGGLFTRKAGDFTVSELVRAKVLRKSPAFDSWATTQYLRSATARLGPHQ